MYIFFSCMSLLEIDSASDFCYLYTENSFKRRFLADTTILMGSLKDLPVVWLLVYFYRLKTSSVVTFFFTATLSFLRGFHFLYIFTLLIFITKFWIWRNATGSINHFWMIVYDMNIRLCSSLFRIKAVQVKMRVRMVGTDRCPTQVQYFSSVSGLITMKKL